MNTPMNSALGAVAASDEVKTLCQKVISSNLKNFVSSFGHQAAFIKESLDGGRAMLVADQDHPGNWLLCSSTSGPLGSNGDYLEEDVLAAQELGLLTVGNEHYCYATEKMEPVFREIDKERLMVIENGQDAIVGVFASRLGLKFKDLH